MAISAGDVMVQIGADTSGLDRALDQTGGKINTSTNKWQKRMRIAGFAIVGAVTGIGVASLKMAADFDKAMREVNTMMLLSEEEFGDFKDEVKGLSRELGVSAVQSAEALYQAISAGVPKENVIDFLAIATKAAIGGVTDTTTAVDGLTTVINAFKLPMSDAQKVADIMFTTVKGGKTTMEELSASMFNVAPIAASAGIEFEVVAAALATMTKQGVPTAQATTQLRQAIVSLMKPTVDMEKAISDLGYESGQAMLAELGFAGAIDVLRESTAGSDEMLLKMFGSVEAGSAILALTGVNAQMFANDLDAMSDSAGAAEDAFDQMEETAARKFEKLKTTFSDMAISLGEALMPALVTLMETLQPIINAIADFVSDHPKLTAAILAVAGAFGILMITVGPIGKAISGIRLAILGVGATVPVIKGVTVAMAGFSASAMTSLGGVASGFAALIGLPGLVAISFAAFTGAVAYTILKWDELPVAFQDGIAAMTTTMATFIAGPLAGFAAAWAWNLGGIQEKVRKVFNALPIEIQTSLTTIRDAFKTTWGYIKATFTFDTDYIKHKSATAWEAIKSIFWSGVNGIVNALNWLIRGLNSISFTLPDWIPDWLGGGKTFGINIPEISLPQFDQGGMIPEPTLLTSLRTGLPYATAGERGVERVSPAGAGGGDVIVTGNTFIVRNDQDATKIARDIYHIWERKARARGIAV